jgi:hypothetical protein
LLLHVNAKLAQAIEAAQAVLPWSKVVKARFTISDGRDQSKPMRDRLVARRANYALHKFAWVNSYHVSHQTISIIRRSLYDVPSR